MDTVIYRRLFSDPAFSLLARDLKDPIRALGALGFVWQGTQELGLVEASYDQLIACFPLGYRGAKSLISALIRSGWLIGKSNEPDRYIVRGNDEQVLRKMELSQRNRQAAMERWSKVKDAQRMHDASTVHAGASQNDARGMPPAPAPAPAPAEERERSAPALDLESPARKTKPLEPFAEAEYRTLMAKHPTRTQPGNFDEKDRRYFGRIVGKRPKDWQQVMAAFVGDDKYQFCGWSPKWLADNVDEVAGKVGTKPRTDPAEKRQAVPSAEETARRLAEQERVRNESADDAARQLAAIRKSLDLK